jgi:hypothetical protein
MDDSVRLVSFLVFKTSEPLVSKDEQASAVVVAAARPLRPPV